MQRMVQYELFTKQYVLVVELRSRWNHTVNRRNCVIRRHSWITRHNCDPCCCSFVGCATLRLGLRVQSRISSVSCLFSSSGFLVSAEVSFWVEEDGRGTVLVTDVFFLHLMLHWVSKSVRLIYYTLNRKNASFNNNMKSFQLK